MISAEIKQGVISCCINLVAIEGKYYLSCNILNATMPFAVLNKDCLHPQVIWRSKLKYEILQSW